MNSSMNKSNNDKDFRVNDLIFAKVRGHMHWPALIVNTDSESYEHLTKNKINFFVTNEFAVVNKCGICLYNENKSKYLSESIALRSRELCKAALIEIIILWEANKLLNEVGESMMAKTPKSPHNLQSQTSFPQCSTPTIYNSIK